MKRTQSFFTLIYSLMTLSLFGQGPKVLVVTAHPDDETGFSVTMFKITHEMKGTVDMAVMTDGGGGGGVPALAAALLPASNGSAGWCATGCSVQS